jgi:hypothetical protein
VLWVSDYCFLAIGFKSRTFRQEAEKEATGEEMADITDSERLILVEQKLDHLINFIKFAIGDHVLINGKFQQLGIIKEEIKV